MQITSSLLSMKKAVGIGGADGHNIGIGLGGVAGGVLDGESVGNLQTGGQRVVAVDNGERAGVTVGKLGRDHVGLHGNNVVALRVNDIEMADALFRGGILRQGDETFLSEEEQRAGLVAVVGGDQNGSALGDFIERGNAVAEKTERLIVDETGGDEVRAVAGVEAVQVRGVLEVVGVKLAVFKSGVGQDVIIENNDLEIVAFLGEEGLDLLKDLGVRGRGSADGDGLFRGGLFGRGFGRSFRR